MLPAMPTPPRRSMWTSTSAESSSTATRVSHRATLTRICFATSRLRRGGGGRAKPRAALVDGERRDRIARQREQLAHERAGPDRPLGADRQLEQQASRRGLDERRHEAAGVDAAIPAPAALAEREGARAREPRDRLRDPLGRRRGIERAQIDLVDEGCDAGVEARRGARDLLGIDRLETLGKLAREPRDERVRGRRRSEIEVDVLVVAREAERDRGTEGETWQRVVALREGERQPCAS